MDLTSIQSALSGLAAAVDLIKHGFKTREAFLQGETATKLLSELLSVYGHAAAVQSQLTAATDQIRDLKQRIVDAEHWATERSRYELHEAAPGCFVYRVKELERGSEPAHLLCANCYQRGVKSILQHETLSIGRAKVLFCTGCNAELVIEGVRHADQPPRPPIRSARPLS